MSPHMGPVKILNTLQKDLTWAVNKICVQKYLIKVLKKKT